MINYIYAKDVWDSCSQHDIRRAKRFELTNKERVLMRDDSADLSCMQHYCSSRCAIIKVE